MNQNLLTTISTAFKQSAINAGTIRRIRNDKISLLLLLLCFCSVLQAQVNLNNGLVAYFPFNGDANDQITGKVGTASNTVVLTTDRFDNPNSAYLFDGSSSIIYLGINQGINSLYNDFTISYWVMVYDNRNGYVLANYSTQDRSCWRMRSFINNKTANTYFVVKGCDGTIQGATSNNQIETYKWYNVVTVRKYNTVSIYINGQIAGSNITLTEHINAPQNPWAETRLGCNWPSLYTNYFKGKIDDLRFYNRAVNSDEVQALYKEGVNTPPVAVAGTDQTINENTLATLDGSGSFDWEGDPLSYHWSAPNGIILSSNSSSKPTFISPNVKKDTTLVFSLVVNDGTVNSSPDYVSIIIKNLNHKPYANAGNDQTVNENTQVTLNGSASSDPDGDALTYLWTAPVGITLNSKNVPRPVFSSPEVKKDTTLIFKLVVNDGIVSSVADQVSVTVKQVNQQPTANAGNDQTVDENKLVTLDGSGSLDADGDPLTYLWTPPSGIALSSNTVVNPTFTAPEVAKDTTFTFSLIVNDGTISSAANTVLITVKQINKAPVANAGNPIEVTEGNMVTLDGSASYDPDGDPLTFNWTAPAGIALSSEIIAKPTFTAPWVDSDTSLSFTLVVNDGSLNSKVDTVIVEVVNGIVPNNLIISDTILSPGTSNCFGAIDSIILAGNGTIVLLENGSSTTLIAGKSILFLPGFHAMYGSFIDAYITSDGTFCEEITPMVSVEKSSTKSTINNLLSSSDSLNIKSRVIVYPNPTKGKLTIETTEKEHNSSVLIYNSIGACIAKTNWINSQMLSIDIPSKQKGIYIVRIIQNGNPVSRKIILE